MRKACVAVLMVVLCALAACNGKDVQDPVPDRGTLPLTVPMPDEVAPK